MGNISDSGVKFAINESKTTSDEQKEKIEITSEELNQNIVEEEELTSPYIDNRSVTIKLVKNYSLYRKQNDKVLSKRRDHIGSSVSSSRILASNKIEIETYFPNIVGIPANNPEFMIRVKQYLNNIRVYVDELGKKFDTSFYYNTKKDYIKVLNEELAIEKEYQDSVKKTNNVKKALQTKINKLNTLETSKCLLGYPINVEDYLMYRHCLLYNDVAKDSSLINSDKSIRFYFEDDKKEEQKLKKHRMEVRKAKVNYVTCISDDVLFDAMYIQYCVLNNIPILSALSEDRMNREIKLDKFSTDEPEKFNKIFNNKDLKIMGVIENLIARGELIRPSYTQNISSVDGEFIGANINEAVAWFKNPANSEVVNVYYNKLKNI